MAIATATYLAVAALAATAYSGIKQRQAAAQAARDQRKAAAVSQAESDATRQQNIRAQVREDRVRRAQILADSVNTGTDYSSGEIGAQSSIGTQIGANVGTLSRGGVSQIGYSGFMQGAANAQARSNTWQAIGGLTSSVAGFAMNSRGFQNDYDRVFGVRDTTKQLY